MKTIHASAEHEQSMSSEDTLLALKKQIFGQKHNRGKKSKKRERFLPASREAPRKSAEDRMNDFLLSR